MRAHTDRARRRLLRRCGVIAIAAAAVVAAGCEDAGAPPRTPQPNPYPSVNGAYGLQSPYATQYGSAYQPAYGWPPPGQPMSPPVPQRRSLDLSLDVPSTTAAATPVTDWLDTRDPFTAVSAPERRSDASGAAIVPAPTRKLPQAYLLVALAVEKIGNHGARANAARKLLASRGAVKRSDNLWEIPSEGPDKGIDAMRAELAKVLCFDDRAALFFAEGGKMVKLEAAGEQACEGK